MNCCCRLRLCSTDSVDGKIVPWESVEQSLNLQQQFTKGPSRFIMANDGSKDCMALLVPDDLIAPLRDLYEDSHHLSGKQGPLDYARREARRSESSIYEINNRLRRQRIKKQSK